MRIFGFEIERVKAPVPALSVQNSPQLLPVSTTGGNWFGAILESFSGAWQRNVLGQRNTREITTFSAVYACVSLIADDVSKCRIKLVKYDQQARIWREVVDQSPFRNVLRKPNNFQTTIQFLNQWMISRLLYGNTYVLKLRDDRSMVSSMYVLDPRMVEVRVDEVGDVWYVLKRDPLSGVDTDGMAVPATEIIHDRMSPLFHPLVGVSPIYACGIAALQGLGIQVDSEMFFRNQAMPGGTLTAPGDLKTETLRLMKQQWDENYGPGGKGKTAVLTNGMKFEALRMNAVDAQLIEQLRWTIEDVARCFHVPLHMLGVQGSNPSYNNIGALTQAYYSQTLQAPIESIELLLDEGLGLASAGYGSELDLDTLVRMDPAARIEAASRGVGAGILTPNEARAREDLPPVAGGSSPYLQQQNYSLAALAKRDAQADPFGTAQPPAPAPQQEPDEGDDEEEDEASAEERGAMELTVALVKRFMDEAARVA